MSVWCWHSEHELLKGEVATVKAAKDKLNSRVVELEEEARKYKEVIEIHKQRSPSEDEVRTWLSLIYVNWTAEWILHMFLCVV